MSKENTCVYKMKLHDELWLKDDNEWTTKILRVPGGWLYNTYPQFGKLGTTPISSTFVPYVTDYEFKAKRRTTNGNT